MSTDCNLMLPDIYGISELSGLKSLSIYNLELDFFFFFKWDFQNHFEFVLRA